MSQKNKKHILKGNFRRVFLSENIRQNDAKVILIQNYYLLTNCSKIETR